MVKYGIFLVLISISLSQIDKSTGQLSKCANSPCQNGGTCIDQPSLTYGYSCRCTAQFTGYNCQTFKNSANVYGNEGVKGGNIGGGIINVNPNYGGGGGGINVNPGGNGGGGSINVNTGYNSNYPGGGSINVNPNYPGGGSINVNPGYNPNYQGGNNVFGQKCFNGGQFVKNGLPCLCPEGYRGNVCQYGPSNMNLNMNMASCIPNPCRNNGICKPSYLSYECTCMNGYYGSRCDYYRNPYRVGGHGKIFGLIIPFLCCFGIISLCIYCCCYKNRNENGSVFMNRAPTLFRMNPQNRPPPGVIVQGKPVIVMQDPDEAFRVNANPPPYEETVRLNQMRT